MSGPNLSNVYKFVTVEEFFKDLNSWETLKKVSSLQYKRDEQTLVLEFQKNDGSVCAMLLQFVQNDTFRVRFNPKKSQKDYTNNNTRSILKATFTQLKAEAQQGDEQFIIDYQDKGSQGCLLTTKKKQNNEAVMQVRVTNNPFKIEVINCEPDGTSFKVWETHGILFTPNGKNQNGSIEDYAIIQAVQKPATGKYIGFGEQGGKSLCRNSTQLNYFNFDNMRYRQVYNYGPLDEREPMYHSEPFFIEFNGVPEKDCVTGMYVDNRGQVLMDLGYDNSNRYMVGTRFGDLDYYFFMADTPAELIESFTEIVGRSRLKPRWALGYHQGCYGYEDRGALEWTVRKHREYQIPLDGLHVDVDVQDNYHTFTINTEKFPDPKGMFATLKAQGIKCSTNITPIISANQKSYYKTYIEGRDNGYFVRDQRFFGDLDLSNPEDLNKGYSYQNFDPPGKESVFFAYDPEHNANTGNPYIGEVYYGNDRVTGQEMGTPGHYPDLGRQEVRDWWGKQYQYLYDMGLEMVWQDMTTPAIRSRRGDMRGFPFRLLVTDDSIVGEQPKLTPAIKVWNLYSYNLHKATYEGLNKLVYSEQSDRPGQRRTDRNFIVGRGSFTGAHRFAALWTGDNSSTWDFLKMNVAQVLSLGMNGVTICGQDVGGFEQENDEQRWVGPELFIRWVAAGAFLPWYRNHYMRKGRKEFQEIFMYEEWFNEHQGGQLPEPQSLYRAVLPVCKYYIELRYRLLQVFYDAMFENTFDGLPICRPLFLNDPEDKALYNDKIDFLDDEFFLRHDILVAPVLDPQSAENGYGKRDVYLPATSNWYTFKDNKQPLDAAINGGTTIRSFNASLNADPQHIPFIVPIFVREGAIVPIIEVEQYVGERHSRGLVNPITLNFYPGDKGEYTMYLDDGISRASAPKDMGLYDTDDLANSEYREVLIKHTKDGTKRQITIERKHDNYQPKEEFFFVALLHDPSEGSLQNVTVDGLRADFITGGSADERSYRLSGSHQNAWYYNENIHISFVKVFDNSPSIKIAAEYNA
jgi:alpha-glucosidase